MSQTVKSIDKLFDILECFLDGQDELTITEIRQKTSFPKSTIFRLLATLEDRNYIKKDSATHRYSLGFKFFHLGSRVQNSLEVRKIALPEMQNLAQKTHETIGLNIVEGLGRICIEKIDSPHKVRNYVRLGSSNPLTKGASGKLLLAFLPLERQKEALDQLAGSPEERDSLEQEIEQIHQNGYSLTKEERIQGSFSISAPLYDYSNQVIAGLSIAGPTQRLTPDYQKDLVKFLRESANDISEQLGYRP
ncbi:IclR family transcriptional regulator [Evansella sp. LMS18]|uniref:IclR family transcriptional regulator n=1 Tax=Evansella sp. LMS18 TaxID=2924033 RepID=UPI0020D1DA57|nr:IclR family transcriptional regulator [Evansella sp. LMS18]UTR12054.1 IclR family transcriptional regulator [Evansella sp. LMS18]